MLYDEVSHNFDFAHAGDLRFQYRLVDTGVRS